MSMLTETTVEFIPPQDFARIITARAGRYGIVFKRDTYHSQVTLLFPNFESMAKVIDKLHADLTNLRKPIEERVWR